MCRMPEHLLQLKSKVGLRGLGCPWGRLGVCAGLWGFLGPLSVPWPSQGPEHIYCSSVSPCGTWLGYSTASRFQLYRVHCDGDGVSLRKVRGAGGRGAWGLARPASLVGTVGGSGAAARAAFSPLPGPQSAQAAASSLPAPVLRRLRQPLRGLRARICARLPAAGAGGLQAPAHTAAALRCGLGVPGVGLGVPGLRIPLPCGCRAGVSPFPALRVWESLLGVSVPSWPSAGQSGGTWGWVSLGLGLPAPL